MISGVSKFLAIGFIFILDLQLSVLAQKSKLKFCAVISKHTHSKIYNTCPDLVKSKNSEVECIIKTDRISCLKSLLDDKADFMIAEPEDLMVMGMTKANNNEVLVTHELRVWEKEPSSFKMVVLIREDREEIWHTENRRLCLSGLEAGADISDYEKYFENKFVVRECNPNKTLLEDRISVLSDYFETACISSHWTMDYQFDTALKEKYGNLCSACGNPLSCSSADKYFGNEGSLLCLTEGGGDIAWSRLDYTREHFKKEEVNGFSFLCPNGTKIANLSEVDPCVWLEKPWRTTIARKDAAEKVSKFLTQQSNEVGEFLKLLEDDIQITPVSIDTLRTPIDYLKTSFPEFYALKDHVICKPDRSIKWCVVSNLEVEKCQWLSYAADTYGVEPSIKCIEESSHENCISSVINGGSHIFAVKTEDSFGARTRGLTPIVHMVSSRGTHGNEVVAIVNKFSDIYALEDLRNHKACFSGYRDAGWDTFVYMMGNATGDKNWYCHDKEMVSHFFSQSCVINIDERNTTFPRNLYSSCSHLYHVAELNNVDEIALNCLTSGGGDVAFISLNPLKQYFPETLEKTYRQLCINGTKSEYNQNNKCILTWTSLGSLMVPEVISPVRKDEIYLMLVELDRLFGHTFQGMSPFISLYGSFDEVSDVIFPENTQYLLKEGADQRGVMNYDKIFEKLEEERQACEANSANYLNSKAHFLICFLLLHLSIIPS